MQKQAVARALGASDSTPPPLPFRIESHSGPLQSLAVRMVGLGVRPELPKSP